MQFSALLGNPVEHSVSPNVFLEFARRHGIEYSHLKLHVSSEDQLELYLKSLQSIGCCGLNITLPYKISIMKCLDEVDHTAQSIGAVNTVVFKNEKLFGYNTDGLGALQAIEKKLRKISENDNVLVLGSGGAARAIIHAIYQITDKVVVFSRDTIEASKLSKDISSTDKDPIIYKHLHHQDDLKEYLKETDYLINATPVGMNPNINESIITYETFNQLTRVRDLNSLYVFDAVFNPHTTKLLKLANEAGSNVCSGIWMLIYQAVLAFELWTGKHVPDTDFLNLERKLKKIL